MNSGAKERYENPRSAVTMAALTYLGFSLYVWLFSHIFSRSSLLLFPKFAFSAFCLPCFALRAACCILPREKRRENPDPKMGAPILVPASGHYTFSADATPTQHKMPNAPSFYDAFLCALFPFLFLILLYTYIFHI